MNLPSEDVLDPGAALRYFASAWRDQPPDWAACEERAAIRFSDPQLPGETALRLQFEHLRPLVQAYGAALRCSFLLGDLPLLQLDEQLSPAAVDQFHAAISATSTVELRFELDKTALARAWFPALCPPGPAAPRPVLYFDLARALEFIAASSLKQLEDNLWLGQVDQRVLLLIPASDLRFEGIYLTLLGGKYLSAAPADLAPLNRAGAARLAQNFTRCREALKWQSDFTTGLTPWHLAGQAPPGCSAHPLVRALHTHLANAFLLFSADRSAQRQPDGTVSSFSSSQQTLDVPHRPAVQMNAAGLSSENYSALLKMLNWAYDPRWNLEDRLALLQIAVVDTLRGAPAEQTYPLLLENAAAILRNLRFHWKGFVEGRINAYTAQVQELETAVSAAVKGYSDQIAALVKGLSESVLAAVGVLIGTFIAALFEKNFNELIFRIGVLGYTGYVFLFPLCYQMIFQWQTFGLLRQDFESRRRRFLERLPADTVQGILAASPLAASQRRFRVWFGVTLCAYLLLIALGLWAAFTVPGLPGIKTTPIP